MKKAIFSLSMFCCALTAGAQTKGDVNVDGVIDVADIAVVIDFMSGKPGNVSEAQADVNSDGSVDVADIGAIIDFMLGKVQEASPINLSEQSGAVTIPEFTAVTVTGNKDVAVTVGGGSVITLSGATFNRLILKGNATVILKGSNKLNFEEKNGNAFTIASGSTVTIKGDGSLLSDKKWGWPSGGLSGDGNLIIEGGSITMCGNDVERHPTSPGINVRNFTLKGGKVTAWGGSNYYEYGGTSRATAINASGNIIITGGEIDANGCYGLCAGGNITISGGTVKAVGDGDYNSYNAGICALGRLIISGGTVTARGAGESPGIGSKATCGDILITGGTITATGGSGAAAIGTGASENGKCGNITIKKTVTQVTVKKGSGATAYIGQGNASSTVGTVTIESGANVIEQ